MSFWNMSAIISYKNGNWKSAEIRKDKNGYFSRGPDISQLPEIVSFLNQIGIQAKSASPDLSISKLVFRFSAHYLNASLMVLGGAVPGKVVTNNRQAVVDYLSADSSFSDYFCQSGGTATGLYAWYESTITPFVVGYPNQDSPGVGRVLLRLDNLNLSIKGVPTYNFDDDHHYILYTDTDGNGTIQKLLPDGSQQVVHTDFQVDSSYDRRFGLQYIGSGRYAYYAWPSTIRVISTAGTVSDTLLADELDISAFFYHDGDIIIITGTGTLNRLNTSTGVVTPIGDPGAQFESAASVDGTVYAVYVQDNLYVMGTVDMETLALSTLGFWAYGNYLMAGPTFQGSVTTGYASDDGERDEFAFWWPSQLGEGLGGDGPGGYDGGIWMEMRRSNFPVEPTTSNLQIQFMAGGDWTDVPSYDVAFNSDMVVLTFVAQDRDQAEQYMRFRYTDQEAGFWSWAVLD